MRRMLLFSMLALAALGVIGCAARPDGGETGATAGNVTDGVSEKTPETDAVTDKPDEAPAALAAAYDGLFKIGVALPASVINEQARYGEVITSDFNSITCENEMKPDSILDVDACRANLSESYTSPKVRFTAAKRTADFAVKHGIKMRLHTLVWHSQTPRWFFTEDYTDNGEPVSREVMLARMESYIASVLGYYAEEYPGLIYAVDVVNEAFDTGDGDENGIRMKKSMWYETIGPDFVYWAFVYARRYAPEGVSLFYNDYACMWKQDLILNNLSRIKDEELIDGIGMQAHLSVGDSIAQFISAVEKFADAGYEIQLTELDVGIKSKEEYMSQGRFYENLLTGLVRLKKRGVNITAVTVWGLSDAHTWRRGEMPLLRDENLAAKPAYEGFLSAAK